MKIEQRLFVAGAEIPIVSFSLTLDAAAPGRGVFSVRSETAIAGDVRLYVGLNGEPAARYFSGVVTRCEKIDLRQRRLLVREYGEALLARVPIALRNSTLRRAIELVSEHTGVGFRISGEWADKSVPHFINSGTGRAALGLVGALSGVDDFTTAFNADGSVYLGPRSELKLRRKVIALDARMFTALSAAGADLPFLPALRPGVAIRIGDGEDRSIAQINVSGEKMRIAFAS